MENNIFDNDEGDFEEDLVDSWDIDNEEELSSWEYDMLKKLYQ